MEERREEVVSERKFGDRFCYANTSGSFCTTTEVIVVSAGWLVVKQNWIETWDDNSVLVITQLCVSQVFLPDGAHVLSPDYLRSHSEVNVP